MTRYEIEISALTEATIDAYRRGLAEGRAEGEEAGQARVVERLKRFRRERVNAHDVGGPVLDEAIARCSATIADVTPMGVTHG
jgi:flagellar biosynthesis/type III secretory pathway protein FliH